MPAALSLLESDFASVSKPVKSARNPSISAVSSPRASALPFNCVVAVVDGFAVHNVERQGKISMPYHGEGTHEVRRYEDTPGS